MWFARCSVLMSVHKAFGKYWYPWSRPSGIDVDWPLGRVYPSAPLFARGRFLVNWRSLRCDKSGKDRGRWIENNIHCSLTITQSKMRMVVIVEQRSCFVLSVRFQLLDEAVFALFQCVVKEAVGVTQPTKTSNHAWLVSLSLQYHRDDVPFRPWFVDLDAEPHTLLIAQPTVP